MSAFQIGDQVRVRSITPPGHLRTPLFIRGQTGEIIEEVGVFPNPEELAYGRDGLPGKTLYRVQFHQTEVWPDYQGPAQDTAVVDIYDHWLERA